jgi:hypothetical protein
MTKRGSYLWTLAAALAVASAAAVQQAPNGPGAARASARPGWSRPQPLLTGAPSCPDAASLRTRAARRRDDGGGLV